MNMREFLDKMREVETIENDLAKTLCKQIKEFCGDKMLVMERKVNVHFGDYKSFDAVAVCRNILMARCENGWCDKPIQPYYANVWAFGDILSNIEHKSYHFEDNPLKEEDLVICV